MWVVVTALLLATPALGHYLDIFPDEPENMVIENTYYVERPTMYMECPPRAICGVAFDFNRTLYGQSNPERRIIHHCRCPGYTPCPIDPAHRLFSSIRRREYLCRPVATLMPCVLGTRRRGTPPAKELVEGSEDYDFYNYFRINCLCPRHHNPRLPKRRRGMELATSMSRVRHDFGRHMRYHERHCTEEEEDEDDDDEPQIMQQH